MAPKEEIPSNSSKTASRDIEASVASNGPRLLNMRQLATYLGVSLWTVRDWILARLHSDARPATTQTSRGLAGDRCLAPASARGSGGCAIGAAASP